MAQKRASIDIDTIKLGERSAGSSYLSSIVCPRKRSSFRLSSSFVSQIIILFFFYLHFFPFRFVPLYMASIYECIQIQKYIYGFSLVPGDRRTLLFTPEKSCGSASFSFAPSGSSDIGSRAMMKNRPSRQRCRDMASRRTQTPEIPHSQLAFQRKRTRVNRDFGKIFFLTRVTIIAKFFLFWTHHTRTRRSKYACETLVASASSASTFDRVYRFPRFFFTREFCSKEQTSASPSIFFANGKMFLWKK